eukprot:4119909-Pyramimonas_sp.AAC.1
MCREGEETFVGIVGKFEMRKVFVPYLNYPKDLFGYLTGVHKAVVRRAFSKMVTRESKNVRATTDDAQKKILGTEG